MQFIDLINDWHPKLFSFIDKNGESRITESTYKFYYNWFYRKKKDNNNNNIVVNLILSTRGNILAASLAAIENGECKHSFYITHRDYRNRGYATLVLARTIEILRQKGVKYKAEVAEDNKPSLKICQKNDLETLNQEEKERPSSKEKYNCLILSK